MLCAFCSLDSVVGRARNDNDLSFLPPRCSDRPTPHPRFSARFHKKKTSTSIPAFGKRRQAAEEIRVRVSRPTSVTSISSNEDATSVEGVVAGEDDVAQCVASGRNLLASDVGLRSSSPLESPSGTLVFFLDGAGDEEERSLGVAPLLPDAEPVGGPSVFASGGLSWAILPRSLSLPGSPCGRASSRRQQPKGVLRVST